MRLWTTYQPKTDILLDAELTSEELLRSAAAINGNLSRENLPEESIGDDEVVEAAFHDYGVTEVTTDGDDIPTLAVNEPVGPTYSTFAGGWREADATHTFTAREGMCLCTFHAFWWKDKYYDNDSYVSYIAFRLLLDGCVVARSGRLHGPNGNVFVEAPVPIDGGSHELKVQYRMSSSDGTETTTHRKGGWFSGQLVHINRRR